MRHYLALVLLSATAFPQTKPPATTAEANAQINKIDSEIRALEDQLKQNPTFVAWQQLTTEKLQMRNTADMIWGQEQRQKSVEAHKAALAAAQKKAQQQTQPK